MYCILAMSTLRRSQVVIDYYFLLLLDGDLRIQKWRMLQAWNFSQGGVQNLNKVEVVFTLAIETT